jgi:CheY-like chemotaxis protein
MDSYNILIVDDEVNNLRALERTFRDEYNVFSATNGEDALSIMQQNNIALIIADHDMPGMTGVEFLERTWQKCPDTIRILLTEYSNEKLLMDAINMGHVYGYITKPWEPEEIKGIIRGGLEAYEKIRVSREPPERRMIGQILIDYGMISEDQLETALEVQRSEKNGERRKLGEILVDLEYTDEESLFFCYALQLGMPYVSLSQFSSSNPELAELLPRELAYKHTIVPVDKIGQVVVMATSEPLSDRTKSEIEAETGYKVMTVCALLRDIEAVLERYYPDQTSDAGET